MEFSLCRHIKTNGKRCKSPALRSRDFCYFHARVIQRQNEFFGSRISPSLSLPSDPPPTPPIELDLPVLEDAESIQISLSLIIAALGRNRIDAKRASTLIYGLRTASINARRIITEPLPETVTCNIVPSGFDTDLAAPEPYDPEPSADLESSSDDSHLTPIHSNSSLSGDVIQEGVLEVK
jgi:hypothetical protein